MPLPFCHSRQALPGEPGWYSCSHPEVYVPARRVSGGFCLICPYSSQPPPVQPVAAAVLQRASRSARCVSLGEQIGERQCASCRGSVRWKVFGCVHPRHRETTLKECETCEDYQAPGENVPDEDVTVASSVN